MALLLVPMLAASLSLPLPEISLFLPLPKVPFAVLSESFELEVSEGEETLMMAR